MTELGPVRSAIIAYAETLLQRVERARDAAAAEAEVLRAERVVLEAKRRAFKSARQPKVAPPALADQLACFLLPHDRQEEVLGDLKERFDQRWLPALGASGAKCCYLWHVIHVSLALAPSAIIGAVAGYLLKKFGG